MPYKHLQCKSCGFTFGDWHNHIYICKIGFQKPNLLQIIQIYWRSQTQITNLLQPSSNFPQSLANGLEVKLFQTDVKYGINKKSAILVLFHLYKLTKNNFTV